MLTVAYHLIILDVLFTSIMDIVVFLMLYI